MHILVLIHEFPPIGGGGGQAANDICKELVKRGHQITVLTAHVQGLAKEDWVDGIRVIRLPSLRSKPYAASLQAMAAFVIAGLMAGLRFIRTQRPDSMHAHFAVPAGALAWMLSILTGVPYILTAHLGDVPGGVPEKTARWFRWIAPVTPLFWRRAKRVVAVSEHTRRLAARNYTVEMTVIPNGVDLRRLMPGEIKLHAPNRLIFAGRFVAQKNPLMIVRALAQLKDMDWRCTMLGDGPLSNDIKLEIKKADLDDRFNLPGWLTPEEVLEEFSNSDVLFMPSRSEGLPVTGVQALAKGLAIIASNIGGFLDLVRDGQNGYLIEPNDQAGFVDSLRTLISDPRKLIQFRHASLFKAKEFDIERVAQQYENILQKASTGKTSFLIK